MSKQYCAASTHLSFEDFANSSQPWDLIGEISAMRAVAVEFRQSLEESGESKAQEFFQDCQNDLVMVLRMAKLKFPDLTDEVTEELEKSLSTIIQQSHSRIFPTSARISAKDAETMSRLLRNVVESAEKYKKIFDGITIGLSRDQDLEAFLINFVVKVVLPNIGVQDRMKVAGAMTQFLPSIQQAAGPSTGKPPELKVLA